MKKTNYQRPKMNVLNVLVKEQLLTASNPSIKIDEEWNRNDVKIENTTNKGTIWN